MGCGICTISTNHEQNYISGIISEENQINSGKNSSKEKEMQNKINKLRQNNINEYNDKKEENNENSEV